MESPRFPVTLLRRTPEETAGGVGRREVRRVANFRRGGLEGCDSASARLANIRRVNSPGAPSNTAEVLPSAANEEATDFWRSSQPTVVK